MIFGDAAPGRKTVPGFVVCARPQCSSAASPKSRRGIVATFFFKAVHGGLTAHAPDEIDAAKCYSVMLRPAGSPCRALSFQMAHNVLVALGEEPRRGTIAARFFSKLCTAG